MIEETISGKERYGGTIETIDYIEYMGTLWAEAGINPKTIFNLQMVLKYLSSRLGKKDSVPIEIGKAHNYLYRAMTGDWYEQ